MTSHQWPLPTELGLDASDPFYNLYTVLYHSHQASSTATAALQNDINTLRSTNSELQKKLANQESQIKFLEQFTKTQRSIKKQHDDAVEELRKITTAKKEIQEQLVNFAKRNVILLNEITQKNKENHELMIKFENAKNHAIEELEELRKEVEEAKNLAMQKQDELENLRSTLSTALFTRNQLSTSASDTNSISGSLTSSRREHSYTNYGQTGDDFDNESTLVASTLRSRKTSSTMSRNMSQETIKTSNVSVYSAATSQSAASSNFHRKHSQDTIRQRTPSVYSAATTPSNATQSPVPKDLHPLRSRGSLSAFSLSLNRNEPTSKTTATASTASNNRNVSPEEKPAQCQRSSKSSHSSLKFWRRNKDDGGN